MGVWIVHKDHMTELEPGHWGHRVNGLGQSVSRVSLSDLYDSNLAFESWLLMLKLS